LPDNVSLLNSLRDEGLLVTTPSQDYDDTYTIEFAIRHNAFIVSNDRYRDYIEGCAEGSRRYAMRKWFKRFLIPYTFVGDEFITIHQASSSSIEG